MTGRAPTVNPGDRIAENLYGVGTAARTRSSVPATYRAHCDRSAWFMNRRQVSGSEDRATLVSAESGLLLGGVDPLAEAFSTDSHDS
jgi:hypothetical protein